MPHNLLDLVKGTCNAVVTARDLDEGDGHIEKGAGHKYRTRKKVGGRWQYTYDEPKGGHGGTMGEGPAAAAQRISTKVERRAKMLDVPLPKESKAKKLRGGTMGTGTGTSAEEPHGPGNPGSAPKTVNGHTIGNTVRVHPLPDARDNKHQRGGHQGKVVSHGSDGSHIVEFHDGQRISYSSHEIKNLGKSQAANPDLVKGDRSKEGSRGGHVIGHTSSGKAIYAAKHGKNEGLTGVSAERKHFRQAHPEYEKKDHMEASAAHHSEMKRHDESHRALSKEAATKYGRPVGHTSGGVAENFPKEVNDKLRHHAHSSSDHSSLAFGHYQASGKRGSYQQMKQHHGESSESALDRLKAGRSATGKSEAANPDLVKAEPAFLMDYSPLVKSRYR